MRASLTSALLVAACVAFGCSDSDPISPEGGGGDSATGGTSSNGGSPSNGGGGSSSDGGEGGNGGTGQGGGGPCPAGVTCVTTFPFSEERNTSSEGTDAIDSYDCSPDTNESGKELLYRLTLPKDGFVSVAVYDDDATDIDVHIVTSLDPAAPTGTGCVARGDLQTAADVPAGEVWIVADTWVNGSGTELAGNFRIDIGYIPVTEGPCDLQTGELERVGDNGVHLTMPASGPVVKEAHLVTQEEPEPFPSTATEELEAHYALSQEKTGLVMHREEVWAPLEGGAFYGAGIGSPAKFPVEDEGWYVNMYWTPASRPPRGTRMILRRPDDPTRAVVVAAGYETGPGDLSRIGGTTEETHYYLGTDHDATLELGFATDQSLPIGPRRCTQ
ncbi:MAG: hypothetical protein HOW73_49160 [Polyangiaceae bacterium]|nr:hypothetical protein [Polyangiaceae bacterium]